LAALSFAPTCDATVRQSGAGVVVAKRERCDFGALEERRTLARTRKVALLPAVSAICARAHVRFATATNPGVVVAIAVAVADLTAHDEAGWDACISHDVVASAWHHNVCVESIADFAAAVRIDSIATLGKSGADCESRVVTVDLLGSGGSFYPALANPWKYGLFIANRSLLWFLDKLAVAVLVACIFNLALGIYLIKFVFAELAVAIEVLTQ